MGQYCEKFKRGSIIWLAGSISLVTSRGNDSSVRRVNFNDRDVHLADIKGFRLRAFDQI